MHPELFRILSTIISSTSSQNVVCNAVSVTLQSIF